jgi:two-component system, chemotaxis family, sensor kinase CheA
MNEFLQQFLIESRELVDQASDDVLSLEREPHDAQRFDDAFRAFHTLKGGAGIVDFAAMQEAVHAAEGVFTAARAESRPLSARDIGNCLACLDQVLDWLDTIEVTGTLPPDADAAAITARFTRPEGSGPASRATAGTPRGGWLDALIERHPTAAAQARTALCYRPPADSFFLQQDPLARVGALPGLLAIDIEPRAPWPPLDTLDPFQCNLAITALLAVAPADAAAALDDQLRHCELEALDGRTRAASRDALPQRARELLEAQLLLLAASGEPHLVSHIASAGIVARNVLRHLGRNAEAEVLAAEAAAAVAQSGPQRLVQAIKALLEATPPGRAGEAATARRLDGRGRTLRVNAERIDALVRLTGELTVAKNAIGHAVKLAENEGSALAVALKNQHAGLDRLVGELQRAVVGMRVLPLRVAFQRFPRLIHELAAELGKPTTLVIEGEDTEADKAIVEILVEPLVHVLRNAMDHGVEYAARRAAAGKPAVAMIRLRAFREGEHVLIEITDDGSGIDIARVREVAAERNAATADELAAMTDAQLIDLIFAPGFSTAPAVTQVSGRGVGMSAVRTAVGRLGGQVEVRSTAGKGTTVRFTLPFSVLVTQVMTVEAAGQTFGIPLDAVVETIRVPQESIFPIGAAHAIVLRDRTIPLVRLAQVLAQRSTDGDQGGPIVVTRIDGELGALQVDRIGERMEIMLKPLDGLLSGLPGIAGSTLLGDGSVLLVLDLAELLQ